MPSRAVWVWMLALCASPAFAQSADGGVTPPSFIEANFHGTEVWTNTSHYEVGIVLGQGGLLFAEGVTPIPLNGVVLRERNGIISYLITVFAGQALSSWAIASSAVEVSNVRTTRSTSTSYDPARGTKTITTESTTTADVKQLKTQEQVDRETETANKSISKGFVGHTFGELAIYAELPGVTIPSRPVGQGYELTFGGHGELFRLFELPVILDVGVHFANVRVPLPASPGLGGTYLFHSAGGLLARIKVPLTRFAAVSVEWIINFLSIGYLIDPQELLSRGSRPLSPLRLTLDVLGISLTAGVRL